MGRSETCLVKVLTLRTVPNSLVILYSCSSGKFGGNPLMYTLGGVVESGWVERAGVGSDAAFVWKSSGGSFVTACDGEDCEERLNGDDWAK